MTTGQLRPKRSFTGHHTLLPASREAAVYKDILGHRHRIPRYTLISWTFGRGSVIWRIWPAVFLHTLFAAAVVSLSLKTSVNLDIPSVMLTVLGVVIGFVIAYRVGSGYDRYWMGRTCWSDLIRNARTMSRLIWFHVPIRLTPKTTEESEKGNVDRSEEEMIKVMAEKHMALDLILGYCVAVKHHLRGELGIYFEDLYHLVRPLHNHDLPVCKQPRSLSPQSPERQDAHPEPVNHQSKSNNLIAPFHDPVVPPINAYGTFNHGSIAVQSGDSSSLRPRRRNSESSHTSRSSQRQPLLPSASPANENILSSVSSDLIPFSSFFGTIAWSFWKTLVFTQPLEVLPPSIITVDNETDGGDEGKKHSSSTGVPLEKRVLKHKKHCPRIAGDGQNTPLQILGCLSDWCSVLEDRGIVPGTTMGPLVGCIATFEDTLSAMERILTTPLPFVYSVHISTVWIYLFFLPLQLVEQFRWFTIPGVFIAAFTYLGFLAAGEEIEQPFGYDDNDLDLDLFCHEIIKADIDKLRTTPCFNVHLKHSSDKQPNSKVDSSQASNEDNYIFGTSP